MRHRFGSRLDPREVVVPVLLEPARPVVNHLEPGAVHPIRPTPTDGPNYDEFDPSKHTQVLRNNSLRPARPAHQLRDIQLRIAEAVNQVPTSRFSDGIEHVRCCRCTGHKVIVLLYGNISSAADACPTPRQTTREGDDFKCEGQEFVPFWTK